MLRSDTNRGTGGRLNCCPIRSLRVVRLLTGGVLLALISFAADSAFGQAPSEPSADDLLRGVRETYTRITKDFDGRLRQGFTKTPFVMSLSPDYLRFRFSDPVQIIHLSVTGQQAVLKEVVKGNDAPVASQRYSEIIRGTDVTYEDLAMRFLYWKNAEVIEETKVSGRLCRRVRVYNLDGVGNYALVDVLIDKASGAMVQMIGYNSDRKSVKRFTVIKVKQFGEIWIPNEMKIETLDPEKAGESLSKTYLKILDVAE